MLNIRAVHLCSFSLFFFLGRVDTKRGLHVTGHLLARMRENRICTRRGIPSRRYGGKRGVKPERLLLVDGAVVADLADDEQQRRVEQGEHARRGSVAVE